MLKNWCFWAVVLEKTLESPLYCKEIQPYHPKGNQSWIVIGMMLKLKLQYSGHLMQRTDSLGKTLMLGKSESGRRRRGRQRMRWLDGITDLMDVHTRECSLPGSSGHGILQARIREWVAMPCSRGWSWPREWTSVSYTAGRFSTTEPPGKPHRRAGS